MTPFGDEPDLALGDSGEWVTQLQTRLHAVRLFDDTADGAFGESTAHAVTVLQTQSGIEANGKVDATTWAALLTVETGADASTTPSAAELPEAAKTPVGALSEDQHWRWDGEHWQPNEDRAESPKVTAVSGGGQHSADGQWLWDGNQWQPVS
jgi:peptidoglycan hydrolase-like protein with peptidoglycan-binding domain